MVLGFRYRDHRVFVKNDLNQKLMLTKILPGHLDRKQQHYDFLTVQLKVLKLDLLVVIVQLVQ